jgi:hypothetical protein
MRDYAEARNNGRDEAIVGYGLSLAEYEVGPRRMEGHPGATLGGESFSFYVPDLDVSIAVSYNLSKKGKPAGKELIDRIPEAVKSRP